MTETIETSETSETSETIEIIGECSVCAKELPSNANHAYTICKHLFCISCLLKWHKASPTATCPMCRTSLYGTEEEVEKSLTDPIAESDSYESDPFFENAYIAEEELSRSIVQELNFNDDEEELHQIMRTVTIDHVESYCREINHDSVNINATYMGVINMFAYPNDEYSRCDYGSSSPNCHYILFMRDAPRELRYRFGRIENIRASNMIEGVNWFVFREMTMMSEGLYERRFGAWSNQIQLISFSDVITVIQYLPRLRINA